MVLEVTINSGWSRPVRSTEVAAFVNIPLYIKVGDQRSKAHPRCGRSNVCQAEQKDGTAYVEDERYKMATTDATSAACKQLGIGDVLGC